MQSSIIVNRLTKKFGNFTSVNNISFDVKKGEVLGFLGANGAGKTTTIRMLCGIMSPTSGDAVVGGYNIVSEPDKVKTRIGYMSQRFSLYEELTVEENINFFGGIYGLENNLFKERKRWALSMADLEGKEDIITGSLPGGIKQRLALGTAVIHKPDIVFLDEPTSGVDPISRRNFWDLINNLSSEGTTIVVTTHYLEEAEFCNNIILIDAGILIAQGNPQKLKTDYIKHKILEVECEKTVVALEILNKEEFVEDVTIFGNSLHVKVDNAEGSKLKIREVLETKNSISIKRLDEITPTLEDVFIHLLEKGKGRVA
jgi:ABC-2 type transport system ATP-binding protein